MKDIIHKTLTFNGVSLFIGIVGGIFGIVSIFIDWSAVVSVKWLVSLIVIFVFIVLILVKIINDAAVRLRGTNSSKFEVIKIINGGQLILINNHPTLLPNVIVSLYYIENGCEIYFGQAYISHIQDEFTQVRILEIDQYFQDTFPEEVKLYSEGDLRIIKKMIIRNVVKIKA